MKERHAPAAVTNAHGQDLPDSTLALMARATAAQHEAILELQALFARKGGDLSTHFLTAENPKEEIASLPCLSFAVLNFSAVTIEFGFGGRSATPGNAIPVPPSSFLQLPIETNIAVIGATLAELSEVEQAMVAFVRFRHLVNLEAGPLSGGGGGGSTPASETANVVTAKSPRSVAVGLASGAVIAANPERKGLSIENTGANAVSLGLANPAIVGDDVVLEPAGSWDGTISGVLWRGAVNAIAAAASSLAVVEV